RENESARPSRRHRGSHPFPHDTLAAMPRKSLKPDGGIARTGTMPPNSNSPRLGLTVAINAQHPDLAAKELPGDGIETVHRDSAEEGLDYLRHHEVDAALLDYHLPGMNGMEMLEEARRSWPHLPVIMVTGMGNEKVAVAALKAGAADYLIKE